MADEFLRSRALIYLSGVLIHDGGLAIVLTHNVWVADWRVLITLLGWLDARSAARCASLFPRPGQRPWARHAATIRSALTIGGGDLARRSARCSASSAISTNFYELVHELSALEREQAQK